MILLVWKFVYCFKKKISLSVCDPRVGLLKLFACFRACLYVFELQCVKVDSWLNLIKVVAAFLGSTIKGDPVPFSVLTHQERGL